MKSKHNTLTLFVAAVFPLTCISCESIQNAEESISIEIASAVGSKYTCRWEEEIAFVPLYIHSCVHPGPSVISEWHSAGKIRISHYSEKAFYPVHPMDVIRYSVVATFETSADPQEYCRKEFIDNAYADYRDEILRQNVDKLPSILVKPLEKMPATVETIEGQRIKRRSDGKISRIDGKAISNESLILRKSGDETPLAEATDEIVYRARSSRGGECYFDFDPSSIGSYSKYLNYAKEPICVVEGDGSTVYA